MEIGARLWAVVSGRPFLCIDGFRSTEIEGQLRDDLPAETEVETATETICGRDGIGIEHIVLIKIDAVGPISRVKELHSDAKSDWTLDIGHWRLEVVRDILRQTYAITLYIIGISGGAERPTVALPIKDETGGVSGGAFLFGSRAKGDPPIMADILGFCHGIVAESTSVVAKAVFITGEIEDIAITEETPVAKTSDVKTEVTTVLVVDTRSFGESITELVVKPRGIVAVEGE